MRRLFVLALASALFMTLALPAQAAGGGATTNGLWSTEGDNDLWRTSPSTIIKLEATRTCSSSEKPVAQVLIKATQPGTWVATYTGGDMWMWSDDIGGQGYKRKTGYSDTQVVEYNVWEKINMNGVSFQTTGPDGADVNSYGEGLWAAIGFTHTYASDQFKVRGKIWCADA